jgi:hypothetical protein
MIRRGDYTEVRIDHGASLLVREQPEDILRQMRDEDY